ncbi:MAG: U32 family peptidase [Candidatus Cloacimonetes bacterium]|jgi:putative protease|nr:U32 family peptidase [Candidatus Cloacimonadota bacterium]
MELLAPAGNLDKLKYAVYYGADAVYAAGNNFGLRAKSTNFSRSNLEAAVNFCHNHDRKIYITVNIFAHNSDLEQLPDYLSFLQKICVDALIISDPGVFLLAREFAPNVDIHISTQANVTSWSAVDFWYKLGAKRIILARELGIKEIAEIKKKVPKVELEMFVHGAMCMSYSGRCLISAFLNNRSANRGLCTQPCRWEYNLVEKSRPGEFFKIEEDERGSYFFNSKDLNLIQRIPEIKKAGIDSIKIEGRMKSLYYVAAVTRAYRAAIKAGTQAVPSQMKEELNKVSHRYYSEAFFDKFDSTNTQHYGSSAYIRDYQFIGEVQKVKRTSVFISIKAKFCIGDEIEFIFPDSKEDFQMTVKYIFNDENEQIQLTKPNTIIRLDLDKKLPEWGIVRKKIIEE